MAKEPKFSDLTTDEKFKAVRDDIRKLTRYANSLSERIRDLEGSLSELRRETQKAPKGAETKLE